MKSKIGMMKIKRAAFLFTIQAVSLFSIPTISFDTLSIEGAKERGDLWSLTGEEVQIRGFWYPLSSEEGVLAPHPQLKSCCVRAPAKMEQQVVVKRGELAQLQPQRALTLEGIFKIDPAYNSKGELVQLFVLEEAKEVLRESESMPWGIAMIVVMAFFFTLASLYRRSKLTLKLIK